MMIRSVSVCRNDTSHGDAIVNSRPLIFDGHNDVLSKLAKSGGLAGADRFLSGLDGAIDLPKAIEGGFGGGFFAVWVPSPMDADAKMEEMEQPQYDLPLPAQIDAEDALPSALSQAAILLELERLNALRVVRTAADIRACMDSGKIAAIFHIEGPKPSTPTCTRLTCSTQPGCVRSARYGAGRTYLDMGFRSDTLRGRILVKG